MSQTFPSANQGVAKLLPNSNDIDDIKALRWWYRLSLPPRPENEAPFKQQEVYRRARLASILLLLMLSIMSFAILVSLVTGNLVDIGVTFTVLITLLIALFLNRAGQLVIEGFLIVGLYTVGIGLSFLLLPALSIDNVIQYDLLAVGILLAATFFPAWSVFVIAAFNCVFIVVSMQILAYDPTLRSIVATEGVTKVVTRPISLIVVVMIITFVWAYNTNLALKRADRAEMIARLQYDLAESDRSLSAQKLQLEHSIQRINETLIAYTSGNQTARVPLTQDNLLWNIAGPINTLLNRAQRMRQMETEYEQLRAMLVKEHQENIALRTAQQKGDYL